MRVCVPVCLIAPQFKEMGFLSAAMVNYLALLGWNDGTEEEIFTPEALGQWGGRWGRREVRWRGVEGRVGGERLGGNGIGWGARRNGAVQSSAVQACGFNRRNGGAEH